MAWSDTKLSLESANDGGDCVGTATSSYSDDGLFAEPFACSLREAMPKGDVGEIVKQFQAMLAVEMNRRQVAAKYGAALQDALNAK